VANKPCVCVHLTAGLDQLELALLSDDGDQIQHVASVNCNVYDATSRRVQQPEDLANMIKQLFVTAKVPMGSLPTVLVLPSYFSKTMSLTSNLSADDINMVLLSEVESHYIFKNQDPVVDWIKLDDQQVLYSAFIRDDVDHWVNAFQELRIPLVTIDTGFFAAIRGLMATGALQSVIEHDRPWMLVILSDNSCQLAMLQGYKIKQAEEIPLGTEDTEMAIQDVTQDIYRMLENQMVDQITLINNTLRINLALIKEGLTVDVPTIDIVQNKHTVQSLCTGVEEVPQYPCTLEALGGVLTPQFSYSPQLNYAPKQGRNLLDADNAKQKTLRWLIMGNVIVALLCAITWGTLQGLIFIKNQQIQASAPSEGPAGFGPTRGPRAGRRVVDRVQGATVTLDENTAYKKLLAKALYERNTWVNNLLIAVGKELPEDAWISQLELTDVPVQAKTKVSITGLTQSTEAMNTFQETLTKLFETKAPNLVSIDADANAPSTYHWKLGLNLSETQPGEAPIPVGGAAP
jgi:Tfp pilus assembly protein PilN